MNILYTLLLCLALGGIQWFIGGTRLLFSLPAYGLLAALGVLSLFSLRRTRLILPDRGCLLASAAFFGYVILRALFSPVAYLAWTDLFMVLAALIVYLLTACYLTEPGRRFWVLVFLLALALLNVAVGARQFAGGDSYMLSGLGRSTQYLGRASGLYICPDHLAGFLEVVGLLTLSIVLWGRGRAWVKLLLAYGVLCCFVGLLLTGSRGGFLSLCSGMFVLVVLSMARVRAVSPSLFPRVTLGLIIGILLVGTLGAYGISKSTLLSGRFGSMVTRDVRFLVWPSAIKEWKTAPVFGTGAETFIYYGRRFRDPAIQVDPINTHNDYLQLLGEYGLAGIAGLLLFLAAHARWGWLSYRHLSLRNEDERIHRGATGSNAAAWNIGALAAAAAMGAHSVVDFNLHIPVNSLVMAFVFGVLANPGRDIPATRQDPARSAAMGWPDYLPRLAMPLLGIWLGWAGLPHLPGEYYAEQARRALRDGEKLRGLNFAVQGLKHERLNPMLYFYTGEARQGLAEAIPNEAVARSFCEAAVAPYRDGLKLYPYDIRLLLRLGSALTVLDRFGEAAPVFEQALVWDPNFAMTHTYYGSYLRRQNRLEEARAAYRRSVSIAGEPAAVQNLQELTNRAAAGSLNN